MHYCTLLTTLKRSPLLATTLGTLASASDDNSLLTTQSATARSLNLLLQHSGLQHPVAIGNVDSCCLGATSSLQLCM